MNRYDKIVRNVGIIIFILMLGTSIGFGSRSVEPTEQNRTQGPNIFLDVPAHRGTAADADSLTPGDTFVLTISEEGGQVIKNFTAKLSWSDESNPPGRPRVRRYDNQPDVFSIRVLQPDGNASDEQGPNSMGDPGNLEISITLDDTYLAQLYKEGIAGTGNWTVEVTLESTGMWTPERGPGMLGLPDSGNDFSISVDYEYYNMVEEGADE
jgi:hypothetical protein